MVAEAACHIIAPVNSVLGPLNVAAAQVRGLLAPPSEAGSVAMLLVTALENVAILAAMSPKSAAILAAMSTMSVGTAPGVTPSGEPPPSWEPVYTPALLIALR